jgi:hypothetical protein
MPEKIDPLWGTAGLTLPVAWRLGLALVLAALGVATMAAAPGVVRLYVGFVDPYLPVSRPVRDSSTR